MKSKTAHERLKAGTANNNYAALAEWNNQCKNKTETEPLQGDRKKHEAIDRDNRGNGE